MKQIFNRRFWKYFVITFVIVELTAILGTVNSYIDLFFMYTVPARTIVKICLYMVLAFIPAAFCISTALASFISFRHLPSETKTSGFFKLLGTGFLCFIPLAVAIYLYDLYIQPHHIKAPTYKLVWSMKTENYPQSIGDDPFSTPLVFENLTPGLSSKNVLYFRIKSLEKESSEIIAECSKLLAILPDTAASKAYDAYLLEPLGVPYQYAPQTHLDNNQIIDIQVNELYQISSQLHDTKNELLEYRIEHYERMSTAIALLLEFLVFATFGYFLRKKTIMYILGVLAVFIVAAFFLRQISTLGKYQLQDAKNATKAYERALREMQRPRQ